MKCNVCQIGNCRSITTNYLLPMGGRMLVIPNAPAFVCDICGYSQHPAYFTEGVHFLLKQLATATTAPQPEQRPAVEDAASWHQAHSVSR